MPAHSKQSILQEIHEAFLEGCGGQKMAKGLIEHCMAFYEKRFDTHRREITKDWSTAGEAVCEMVLLTARRAANRVKRNEEMKQIEKEDFEMGRKKVKAIYGSRWC